MQMQEQPTIEQLNWKRITYKDGHAFDGKFIDDKLVLKKEIATDNLKRTLYFTYKGTFNENYELHGDNCTVIEEVDGWKTTYTGTFENGVLKNGKEYYNFYIKKGEFGGNSIHELYLITGEYDDKNDTIYKGEFYCDPNNNILKKGTITKKNIIIEGEFSPDGRIIQGKVTNKIPHAVFIKEGTFDLNHNNIKNTLYLTNGKQTLHNGVTMEGTFINEQLQHGTVTYPNHNTLSGNFDNGCFDINGKFWKHKSSYIRYTDYRKYKTSHYDLYDVFKFQTQYVPHIHDDDYPPHCIIM